MQRYFSILLLIPFFVVASGCNDGKLKTYPVSGTITYQGEPLVGATVGFTPKSEGSGDGGFARTDEKGFYQLQTTQGRVNAGTTPGEYYVTITKVEMVGTGVFRNDPYAGQQEEMKPVPAIPAKYSSAEGGLSATVTKGKNVLNFDLGDDP